MCIMDEEVTQLKSAFTLKAVELKKRKLLQLSGALLLLMPRGPNLPPPAKSVQDKQSHREKLTKKKFEGNAKEIREKSMKKYMENTCV